MTARNIRQLPVGARWLLGFVVTAKDQVAGLTSDVHASGPTVDGSLLIAPDGTITGAITTPLSALDVAVLRGAPVQPGDVLQNDRTGETLVVRSAWLDSEDREWRWTDSATGPMPVYPTDGWTRIGEVTFNSP